MLIVLSKGRSQGLTYKRTTSTSTFSAKVFLASVPSLPTQIARSLLVLQKNKQTNKQTKKQIVTLNFDNDVDLIFAIFFLSVLYVR